MISNDSLEYIPPENELKKQNWKIMAKMIHHTLATQDHQLTELHIYPPIIPITQNFGN